MHNGRLSGRRHWRRRGWIVACAVACAAVIASNPARSPGADVTWDNDAANAQWGTAINWSGNALPAPDSTVVFAGAIGTTIDLGGATRQVAAVRFIADPYAPSFHFLNGTLQTSRVDSFGSPGPANQILCNLDAGTGALVFDVNGFPGRDDGGAINMYGTVTAGAVSVLSTVSHNGGVYFDSEANTFTSLTVDNFAQATAYGVGAFSNAAITVGAGYLEFWGDTATPGGTAAFNNSLTVTGFGVNVYAASDSGDLYGGTLRLNSLTVVPNPTGTTLIVYETGDGYDLAVGPTTIAGRTRLLAGEIDYMGRVPHLVLDGVTGNEATGPAGLDLDGQGVVTITAPSTYTGGTNVHQGSIVAAASGALGTGTVTVHPGASATFAVPQAVFPSVDVHAFAAITGNLAGAFTGGTVTLAPDAIVAPTDGAVPTRGAAGAAYWRGVSGLTQSFTVGDDGTTSPFKGVAFGPQTFTPDGNFAGTVGENVPGQGIEVYVGPGYQYIGAATFNTTNTTTGVRFSGPGDMELNGTLAGTATLFTFTTPPGHPANYTRVYLNGPNVLPAGKTLRILDGWAEIGHPAAVQGTVEVGPNAVFGLFGTRETPTSGTFNIRAGGAIYIHAFLSQPGQGTSVFNFEPGGAMILSSGYDTGSPTWLSPNADILFQGYPPNTGRFTGSGIVLGDGRRFTTQPDVGINLTGGTGISAFPGTSKVLLTSSGAAGSGAYLNVYDNVNLPGVDLQLGDAGTFRTARFLERVDALQRGEVNLLGNAVVARDLIVQTTATVGEVPATVASFRNIVHPAADTRLTLAGTVVCSGTVDGAGDLRLWGLSRLTALRVRERSLYISSDATVRLAPGAWASGASRVTQLEIADGRLDLGDGLFVVDYAPSETSPFAQIATWVAYGAHDGHWDGAIGIMSSVAADPSRQFLLAVGYAEAAAVPGLTTFGGVDVDASAVLLRLTWVGDANLDGVVDGLDRAAVTAGMQRTPGTAVWSDGDFNRDGRVDGDDWLLLNAGFAVGHNSVTLAVPEPAAPALVLVASGALFTRRRHRPSRFDNGPG
jgi:autotransporter-associated beta strand protein